MEYDIILYYHDIWRKEKEKGEPCGRLRRLLTVHSVGEGDDARREVGRALDEASDRKRRKEIRSRT